MTMAEARAAWERGEPVMIVEYRKSIAEVIEWRDKGTQKPMTAPVLRHTVESASASLTVTERVPDTFNALGYKSPFKKSAKVVLWLTEWKQERGTISARGVLSEIVG